MSFVHSILLRIPVLREFVVDHVLLEIEQRLACGDCQKAFRHVLLVWKTSRGVFGQLYVDRYDAQRAQEFRLIRRVINNCGKDSLKFFCSLFDSESAQLVGYAIIGLANYGDESVLRKIPHGLKEDLRNILLLSSVVEDISIGELITRVENERV